MTIVVPGNISSRPNLYLIYIAQKNPDLRQVEPSIGSPTFNLHWIYFCVNVIESRGEPGLSECG